MITPSSSATLATRDDMRSALREVCEHLEASLDMDDVYGCGADPKARETLQKAKLIEARAP